MLVPTPRTLVAALALFASACAGEQDARAKELDRLRAEVGSLRSQAAAMSERVAALEGRGKSGTSVGASPASQKPDRPQLSVLTLTPEGPASPRPTEAETGATREVSVEPVREVSAAETAAQADFFKAKELVSSKKLDLAITALSDFASRFPDHQAVPEATFLRAQCLAQKGEKKRAAEQLEAALAMSGADPLSADILSELAKARERLGDPVGARRARERLKAEFPTSAAAKRLLR